MSFKWSRRESILISKTRNIPYDHDLNFLEDAVFIPYLISNKMIVKYENNLDQRFSIKQILVDQTAQAENGEVSLVN